MLSLDPVDHDGEEEEQDLSGKSSWVKTLVLGFWLGHLTLSDRKEFPDIRAALEALPPVLVLGLGQELCLSLRHGCGTGFY